MYSLVVLLVLAGFLALDTAPPPLLVAGERGPGRRHRAAPAHPLLGVLPGGGGGGAARPAAAATPGARRALLAMALGSLLFVPWLPSFLEQMARRGPRGERRPSPGPSSTSSCSSRPGCSDTSLPLGLLLYALLALGLFGAAAAGGGRIVTLDLRGRPPGRTLAAAAGLTMALAIVVGQLTNSAFAIRYAAVVLPPGAAAGRPGQRHPVGHLGRPGGVGPGRRPRLRHRHPQRRRRPHVGRTGGRRPAGPGPAGRRGRLLPRPAGPVGEPPARRRAPRWSRSRSPGDGARARRLGRLRGGQRATATGPFAQMLVDRAGPDHAVWVVWAPGYRTFGTKCQGLLTDLRQLRPDERRVVKVIDQPLRAAGSGPVSARVGCGPWLIRIRNSTSSSSGPAPRG